MPSEPDSGSIPPAQVPEAHPFAAIQTAPGDPTPLPLGLIPGRRVRPNGASSPMSPSTDYEIRKLSEGDSLEELTRVIHRAYARLGAMGLNFTAVDQPVEVTKQRVRRGVCFIAVLADQLIGTITVQPPEPDSECGHFRQPHVASARQFAVCPAFQGIGLGGALLAAAETWAARRGYSEIAIDTAEPARHLVDLYSRRGFREVGWVRWPGKTYRSVVMSKALEPGAVDAEPSKLESP